MDDKTIVNMLAAQYNAGLGMLRHAIGKTPEELWQSGDYRNPVWQIAYHIVWGVHFYLGASPEAFVPLENAIPGAESLGGEQGWENPDEGVAVEGFHTKEELMRFIDVLEESLQQRIAALPLTADAGFEWYPCSRLELHINNIRHIQHHTAQIIERLKAKSISGFPWWTGKEPPQEW